MKYLLALAICCASIAQDVRAVEVTIKTDIRMYVGRINAFGYIDDAVPPYAYNPEAAKFTQSNLTVPLGNVMATSVAEVVERLSAELRRLLGRNGFNPRDFWMQVSIQEEAGGIFQPPDVIGQTFNVETLERMP